MANILPNAETQFVDSNGNPYALGKVYFYIPNTSTPKDTWQDIDQMILNTNPVVLDAAGRALIWGAGNYRQVLEDADGNVIWDQVTSDSATGILSTLAADTGASLIGTASGQTVQEELDSLQSQIVAASTGDFTPSQNNPLAMNIIVGPGKFVLAAGQAPISQAQQTTSTIVAPVGNPRIDRVVMDENTGVISVVTGTPAASPVAPAVPSGKFPIAQILLQTSTTSIVNSQITDERSASRSLLTAQYNKTTDYTILPSDLQQTINFTGAGASTFSFTAAATLGNQWFCYLSNGGTADVTLDPNGSETIDGLTSYIMYPGETRLVMCNGTLFTTKVLHGFSKSYTSSGTFTCPPGYQTYDGFGWGGGASGGAGTGLAGGGGGGGVCIPFRLAASLFGTSQSVTVGAGGVAVSGNTAGNAGGNSSIGALITFYGGGPGAIGASSGTGGSGGLGNGGGGSGPISAGVANPSTSGSGGGGNGGGGAGGGLAVPGQSPTDANAGAGGGGVNGATNAAVGTAGGDSFNGGAGGGGGFGSSASQVANGGIGRGMGGSGGNGGKNGGTAATSGAAPAGGGGGACNGTSGAGARGEVRIYGVV